MTQDIEFYERRFSEIFDLISDLREKVFIKDGVWLKKHRYSREQLFHDPLLYKLSARYGAIEYNLRSWKEAGSVESVLLAYCEQNLTRVEQSIEELLGEIEDRKPTGWERIRDFLLGMVKLTLRGIATNSFPKIGPGP
jgi:hypothetical protein